MYVELDDVFFAASRNLGLKDWKHFTDEWIEWALEAEKYIGSVDTFRKVETTYTSSGEKASGTITFDANPSSGDWIELNGARLYFRDNTNDLGGGQSSNEIAINTTLALTMSSNLPGLINHLSGYIGADVTDSTGHDTASVMINSALYNYPEALNVATYSIVASTGVLTITAREIGSDGNNYTLASSNSNASISGSTLTGGKGLYRNQQIILPDNMIKLLGVRVGTDDSTHEHREVLPTSAVHFGRVGKTSDDSQQRAFRYYVDGNRLNITHDDIDEITIVYYEYPTDMRGWPMVKESHTRAVSQYIMWQHKLIDYYNAKVPQYIVKDLEKRWYYLCGKSRGDDGMPSSADLKQIGNMWNTLIPLRNTRGLIDF